MHLQKIQRLEDKGIFVTQGDLLNLWFLMSKESKSKRRHSDIKPDSSGLNHVADLLAHPDGMAYIAILCSIT